MASQQLGVSAIDCLHDFAGKLNVLANSLDGEMPSKLEDALNKIKHLKHQITEHDRCNSHLQDANLKSENTNLIELCSQHEARAKGCTVSISRVETKYSEHTSHYETLSKEHQQCIAIHQSPDMIFQKLASVLSASLDP